MDYATDYEEWLLRYNNAKDSLLIGAKEETAINSTSDADTTAVNRERLQHLVATMMTVRAGRLGSLQCALMEEEEKKEANSQHAELLREFYQFTKSEMEADESMGAEMKALEAFLPNVHDIAAATTMQAAAINMEVDIDAFFDEYPECLRDVCQESDSDSADDDDDDESIERRVVAMEAGKPKSHRVSKSSAESNVIQDMRRDTTDKNQFIVNNGDARHSASQVCQRQQEIDLTNDNNHEKQVFSVNSRLQASTSQDPHHEHPNQRQSSTLAPSFYEDAVPPRVQNPYDRRKPAAADASSNFATTSASAAHHSSAPRHPEPRRSRPIQAPISKQQSWEDLRNQNNPFQSAREYGQLAPPTIDEYEQPSTTTTTTSRAPPGSGFSSARNPYITEARVEDVQQQQQQPDPTNRGQPIRESLKRKFQPPKRSAMNESKAKASINEAGGTASRPSSKGNDGDDLPEQLKGLDKDLVEKIQNEIMESGESVTFNDIAGLKDAKQTIFEVVCWPMKRPDLFTGLRRAPNGLLLYGPPGTGKTLIGKAIAHESGATFFSISSSSLTSKWIGEGEKLVRTLFAVAAYREPAVVFIDEIDSLLTQRKADENEASRRIKTEFLVQLDGTGTSGQGRVLIIGATNRPQELDEAARRRFVKRLYIPLPAREDREALIRVLLDKNNHCLTDEETEKLAEDTQGFSGADLKSLCTDAAMGPIRELGPNALEIAPSDVPPIAYKHFRRALRTTKPSVAPSDLVQYEEWDKLYGSRNISLDDDDDDDD